MTIDTAKERSNFSTCPACAGGARKGILCVICLGAGVIVRAPRYHTALDVVDAQAAEIERLHYVLGGVARAIDTGRNEPLQIWRDQIAIALSEREP